MIRHSRVFRELGRCAAVPAVPFLALLLAAPFARADVIHTHKQTIECRVLEDSRQVLVVETLAGEYVVVDKGAIRSIVREPDEEFFHRRAVYFLERGDENAAILDFLQVLERNPGHERAAARLEAIRESHRRERMNEQLSQADEWINEKEYRKAIRAFERALEFDPDERTASQIVRRMSDTHARMAFVFYDHCYEQGAIVELARAEELNPENAEIYFVLAKIHEADRNYELARLEYERALELDPQHSAARSNLMELIEAARGAFVR